jgi:hypothetical protein
MRRAGSSYCFSNLIGRASVLSWFSLLWYASGCLPVAPAEDLAIDEKLYHQE